MKSRAAPVANRLGECRAPQRREEWRKRMGVEPTKERLTPLTGFEARPPHRGSIPSAFRVTLNTSRTTCNLYHRWRRESSAAAFAGRIAGARHSARELEACEAMQRFLDALLMQSA